MKPRILPFIILCLALSSKQMMGQAISGTKTIGASGCDYTTITAAISSIQSNGLSGNVILELASNYSSSSETYPLVFANLGTSDSSTLTVRPASGVSSVINLSHNSTSMTSGTVMRILCGYVIIDGRPGGTGSSKYLSMTGSANFAKLQIGVNSRNDTVRYCTIKMNSSFDQAVYVSDASSNGGNQYNAIEHCDIEGGATGISGIGSPGALTSCLVSNCNIYNFHNEGISISVGCSGWTISDNDFYQTDTVTTSFAQAMIPISVGSGTGHVIEGNHIHDIVMQGANFNTFKGIYLYRSSSLQTSVSVQGNIIDEIYLETTGGYFSGIQAYRANADIGTVEGNRIGSETDSASIVISSSSGAAYGVSCEQSDDAITLAIENNIIGGIRSAAGAYLQNIRGIIFFTNAGYVSGSAVNIEDNKICRLRSSSTESQQVVGIYQTTLQSVTITGNEIFGLENTNSSSSAALVIGIWNETPPGATQVDMVTINDNLIYDLYNHNVSSGLWGIYAQSRGRIIIEHNTIHTLINSGSSGGAGSLYGIYYNYSSTGTQGDVARNFVSDIRAMTSGSAFIMGIYTDGQVAIYNNMVKLGLDGDGNSLTNAHSYWGISNEGSEVTGVYFNSVYIGGTGTDNTISSYAMWIGNITSNALRSIKNNILVNARTFATASWGANYALVYSYKNSLASHEADYNILYAPGTSGQLIMRTNAAGSANYNALSSWQSATGFDNHSYVYNPAFEDADGAWPLALHLDTMSLAEGAGTPVSGITEDIDGDTRSSATPSDIGADAGDYLPLDIAGPVITFTPLANTGSVANLSVTIIDTIWGVLNSGSYMPKLWYRNSTTGSSWMDTAGSRISGDMYNGTWSFLLDYNFVGGVPGDTIQYYVVAQDYGGNLSSGDSSVAVSHTDVNTQVGVTMTLSYTIIPDTLAPAITFTPLANTSSPLNRTLVAVIADTTGVFDFGVNMPKLWYRNLTAGVPWTSGTGSLSSGNANNGTWSFSIDYNAIGGTPDVDDTIEYYIVAENSQGHIGYGNSSVAASHIDVNTQVRVVDAQSYIVVADTVGPVITFTPLTDTVLTANRTLSVTVADAGRGIPFSGAYIPRLWYRNRTAGTAWTYAGSSGGGSPYNSTWSFTLDLNPIGIPCVDDTIEYYVVAQDVAGNIGYGDSTVIVSHTDVATRVSATTVLSYKTLQDTLAPVITFTALINTYSIDSRTLNATIVDTTGVFDSGAYVPKLWYRNSSDASAWIYEEGSLTSGTVYNGAWTFTISYDSIGGTPSSNDVIQYYVVAQDIEGHIGYGNSSANASHTDVNTQVRVAAAVSYTIIEDSYAPEFNFTALDNTESRENRAFYVPVYDGGRGVPLSGSYIPRIWYRNSTIGTSWASSAATLYSGNSEHSTWGFTIDYSAIGGTPCEDDIIQYYLVAQDKGGNIRFGDNSVSASHTDVNTQVSVTTPLSYTILADQLAPTVSFTPLGTTHLLTDRTFSVSIVDPLWGVYDTGAYIPKLWYRNGTAATAWNYTAGSLTSGSNTNGAWSFTFDYDSIGGTPDTNDVIQYYVVAHARSGHIGYGNNSVRASHTNANTQVRVDTALSYMVRPDNTGPVITFTPLANTGGSVNLTAAITDATWGVQGSGSYIPKLWYRNSTSITAWASAEGSLTSGDIYNGTWSFTLDPDDAGAIPYDTLEYYVVAQDQVGNVGYGDTSVLASHTDVNSQVSVTSALTYTVLPDTLAPVITFTPLTNPAWLSANRTFSATISDTNSGVADTGEYMPKLWFRKSNPVSNWNYTVGSLTSGNAGSGTWSFTLVYDSIGGLNAYDVIEYYVVAQNRDGHIGYGDTSVVAAHTDVNTQTRVVDALSYGYNPDTAAPVIDFIPLTNTASTANRSFNASIVETYSGLQSSGSYMPRLWCRNRTAGTSWTSAAGSFVSASGSLSTWSFTLNYTSIGGTPGVNDTIEYYVTAQDLAGNMGYGDTTVIASHTDVNTQVSVTTPLSYVVTGFTGTKTVCASGCDYTSLTGTGGIFAAINNSRVAGDFIISIRGNLTETGANALNQVNYFGGTGSITIRPDTAVVRIISGSSLIGPLINMNGADNITIDGSYSGSGRYLLFRNSSPSVNSVQPVIQYNNGCSGAVLTKCIIESNSGSFPNIMLGFSGINQVTISGNNIGNSTGGTTGSSMMAIFSASVNNTATVTSNNIYNWGFYGVNFASIGNGCVIRDNSFYNSLSPSSYASIYVGSGQGHTITGNYIGGSSPNCGGSAWTNSGSFGFTGIYFFSFGGTSATTIRGNTIQNISVTAAFPSQFAGINAIGNANVDSNIVGHNATANSIVCNGEWWTVGIYSAYSTVAIVGNTVANIKVTGTSSWSTLDGIRADSGTINITGNTIHTLRNSSSGGHSGMELTGIRLPFSNLGPTMNPAISGNTIYDIQNTSDTSQKVAGIYFVNTGGTSLIERNRVYDIKTSSTRYTLAKVIGIGMEAKKGNSIIANNQVSITNSGGSDHPELYGILYGDTAPAKIYHNSVYIGGSAGSGSQNTYAFLRDTAGTIALRNNIFYNARSGGSGYHAAIGNDATGWSANMSNYNLLVGSDTSAINVSNSSSATFSSWRNSGSDENSISHTPTVIPAAALFVNAAAGNLNINTDSSVAWLVNGRGMQLSGYTKDFGSTSAGRPTDVADGAPDLGSDEFTPTGTPPAPETSGTIGAGNRQSFVLAKNMLSRIDWDSSSTSLPSTISCKYYSGTTPPGHLEGDHANAYWRIEVTGGTSYEYSVTLHYDPALLGTIASEDEIIVWKKPSNDTTWTDYTTVTLDTANNLVTVSGLTSFSDFTLGGGGAPLPVKLMSFTGHLNEKKDVELNWTTASELNNDRFEIERSADGKRFHKIGTVRGHGNSQVIQNYSFVDEDPLSGISYYRLRQVDYNGEFEYSRIVTIMLIRSVHFSVYPNPANSNVVWITLDEESETDTELRLLNMQGQVIKSHPVSNVMEIKFDIPQLKPGVYLLQLSTPTNTHTEKLIIRR